MACKIITANIKLQLIYKFESAHSNDKNFIKVEFIFLKKKIKVMCDVFLFYISLLIRCLRILNLSLVIINSK